MPERYRVDVSELFYMPFDSTEQRLERAYNDPAVHDRFSAIMRAPESERPELRAQLNAYLASAYALFPEESQIIHDSISSSNSTPKEDN